MVSEKKEKPLEKMTSKELRDVAVDISEITGAHGMNKAELIQSIKKAKGIKDTSKKVTGLLRDIKKKIKELKVKQIAAREAGEKKTLVILRRKISRLKKKSRRAA